MTKKSLSIILSILMIIVVATGCQLHQDLATEEDNQKQTSTITNTVNTNNVENVEVEFSNHAESSDYTWNTSNAVSIELNGDSVDTNSKNVNYKKEIVEITEAGTYVLSGDLDDGQILVDTEDEETVQLVLNGVTINSEDSAPIYVKQAEKVVVILANNSVNTLEDADGYTNQDDNEPNAALFSKADLSVYGESGSSLNVTANYKDAISSKDGLIIENIALSIDANDDGIDGKDYTIIKNSTVKIEAGGDGIKSDNEEDAERGYINIQNSNLDITAAGDSISATNDITIDGQTITLQAGGGSSNKVSEDTSTKGIKTEKDIIINSGIISISSADDSIHTNDSIEINGGTLELSSGDDGIHADTEITINDGNINITKSYEAIEAANITVNDGTIYMVSSDDGFNVAGGNDSSSTNGRPGQGGFAVLANSYLTINGGYIYLNANGDGLDSNGSVIMTGGLVIVNGPTNNGNGAIDYNGTFKITGGTLIAAGSSGMAEAPTDASTQYSMLVNFTSGQSAGTLINITDSQGNNVLTFAPAKTYQSIVLSSADLTEGETYTVSLGGSSTGTNTDGLYSNGVYSSGTENTTVTLSSITTKSGTSTMGGGMMGGGGRTRPGTTTDGTTTDFQMPTDGTMPTDFQGGREMRDMGDMTPPDGMMGTSTPPMMQ